MRLSAGPRRFHTVLRTDADTAVASSSPCRTVFLSCRPIRARWSRAPRARNRPHAHVAAGHDDIPRPLVMHPAFPLTEHLRPGDLFEVLKFPVAAVMPYQSPVGSFRAAGWPSVSCKYAPGATSSHDCFSPHDQFTVTRFTRPTDANPNSSRESLAER